jgi:hypothetical protein
LPLQSQASLPLVGARPNRRHAGTARCPSDNSRACVCVAACAGGRRVRCTAAADCLTNRATRPTGAVVRLQLLSILYNNTDDSSQFWTKDNACLGPSPPPTSPLPWLLPAALRPASFPAPFAAQAACTVAATGLRTCHELCVHVRRHVPRLPAPGGAEDVPRWLAALQAARVG